MKKALLLVLFLCICSVAGAQMNRGNVSYTLGYAAGFSVGELQGVTTATICPTVTGNSIMFRAEAANAGNCYIGGSGVTKANGTTDVTTGIELDANMDTGWIPARNLNQFYRICDNTGDDLTYMVLE